MTLLALISLILSAPTAAAPAAGSGNSDIDFPLGPLPASAKIVWAHAPYQDGDCSLCHERKDPKNPGKLNAKVPELCYSCHDEFVGVMGRQHLHKPAKKNCSNCHNAHNSTQKKLLHAAVPKLCWACHDEMEKEVGLAKVQHQAIKEDRLCLNCHNPHASEYERLLVKAPFDLCVSCHGKDDVKDPSGKKLTNIGKLVADSKVLHKPVAEKDCSACHLPHGGPNFRLLVDPYPPEFYSAFEPAKYALCWECHKADMIQTRETTTLTKFRDGSKNLHFVHVNVANDRGRTCRACHEVHGAQQTHLIRDSVPFGPRGWLLKTNFQPLPNGGSCEKTCHAAKSYVNKSGAADPKAVDPKVASSEAKDVPAPPVEDAASAEKKSGGKKPADKKNKK